VQSAVLETIYVAGVLGVALVAPNAVRLLASFEKERRRKTDPKYAASRAFHRLVDGGYITLEKTRTGTSARLSATGERFLATAIRHTSKFQKPKKWDGQWRIVSFDIKEKRKFAREKLRATLTRIGFVRLQNSVWVFPYDCEDLIALIKLDCSVGKDVLYLIAARLGNDLWLRDHFGLRASAA